LSKYVHSQTNFTKGEIAQSFLGNSASEEYNSSVSLLSNFIPRHDGSIYKRPGTVYRGEHIKSTASFMIPFISSDEKQWIISIIPDGKAWSNPTTGPIYFCNVSTGGYLTATKVDYYYSTISGIKAISSLLDVNGFHYAISNDVIIITHNSGMMEPILIKYVRDVYGYSFIWTYWNRISSLSNILSLGAFSTPLYTSYLDRNVSSKTMTVTAVGAIAVTCSAAFFTGSMVGSLLRISNGSVEGVFRIDDLPTRQTATFTDATDLFSVAAASSTGVGIVFHGIARIPEPLQIGKIYYCIKISATDFKVASTYDNAIAGTFLTLTTPADGVNTIYVTPETPGTVANGTTLVGMPGALTTDNWTLSAFGDFQGWPKTCSFFENRLFFGGTFLQPDTIFASLIGNLAHFMQRRLDQDYQAEDVEKAGTPITGSDLNYKGYLKETDAFSFTLSTNESGGIRWLCGGKSLFCGTDTSEIVIGAINSIISATNIKVQTYSSFGSTQTQAIKFDQSLFYIPRTGDKIHDFIFIDTNGAFVSVNLNAQNKDILYNNYTYTGTVNRQNVKYTQMAYDAGRSVIWVLTSTYQLVGISYNRQFNLIAWHRHTIGGTNVKVHSICTLKSLSKNIDDVFLVVERTVAGVTKFFYESIDASFEEDYTHYKTMNYVDCSATGLVNNGGIGLNKANGFTHLIGQTGATCTARGRKHPNVTVAAAGVVTLDKNYVASDLVTVGYSYDAKIELNPIQAGGDFGVSTGTLHRTDRITVRLYKTLSFKYSPTNSTYIDMFTADTSTTATSDLSLFTGEQTEYIENDHETYNKLYFKHDLPFPCNVLSITQRGISHGG